MYTKYQLVSWPGKKDQLSGADDICWNSIVCVVFIYVVVLESEKKKKKLRGERLIENRVKFKRLEINEKKKKWNLKDLIENISKLEGVICNCSLIFVYEALVF